MSSKQCFIVPGAPEPGPYSHAVRCGNLLFLSGQVADDPVSGETLRGDIAFQTRRTLENIKIVLEGCGSRLENVLKVTVYLTDIGLRPAMNEVYTEFFPHSRPARAAVAVKDLGDGVDIEIDVIAVVDPDDSTNCD